MLVVHKLKGKIVGRKVVFSERTIKLHKGKVAYAKGSSAPKNEVIPTGPWGPQIPYINQLFQGAGDLFSAGPPQYFPGQTVLPENQLITDSRNATIGQVNANAPQTQGVQNAAATNAAGAYANPVAGTAGALTPDFMSTITQLLGGGGGQLGQTGANAAPLISQILGRAGNQSVSPYSAPTLATGQMDVNPALQAQLNGGASPFLAGTIDSALRASNNNFNRNILPGIGDAASGAGQVGGSRQGIAQGIAAGDLMNQQTDIISQIMQSGFEQQSADRNQAISSVLGAQGQNAQNTLATNQLNEALRSAVMGEALSAGGLGAGLLTGGAQLGQQGQTTGSNLVAQLLAQGQSLGTDAFTKNAALLPLLQQSGLSQLDFANQMGLQQYGFGQNQLDSEVERWFYEQYAPYNALTQFQNFISGPYGSSVAGQANQQTDQNTGALLPMPTRRNDTGGSLTRGFNPLTGLPGIQTSYSTMFEPWKWF